jgi:hypothetical protein
MHQFWIKEELTEHLSLLPDERCLFHYKMEKNQLVFSMILTFSQDMGRFPEDLTEFPKTVINYLATKLNLRIKEY